MFDKLKKKILMAKKLPVEKSLKYKYPKKGLTSEEHKKVYYKKFTFEELSRKDFVLETHVLHIENSLENGIHTGVYSKHHFNSIHEFYYYTCNVSSITQEWYAYNNIKKAYKDYSAPTDAPKPMPNIYKELNGQFTDCLLKIGLDFSDIPLYKKLSGKMYWCGDMEEFGVIGECDNCYFESFLACLVGENRLDDDLLDTRGKLATPHEKIEVTIIPDDYHIQCAGKNSYGEQIFITPDLVYDFNKKVTTDFIVVYIWDSNGNFLTSEVFKIGNRGQYTEDDAGKVYNKVKEKYFDIKLCKIKVKPCSFFYENIEFGLIPNTEDDFTSVQVMPGNCISFTEPFNGEYDT